MNTLKFYKFIHENGIEYHWNEEKDDVHIFVNFCNLDEFKKLFHEDYLVDHRVECLFQWDCLCIKSMKDILRWYGIELEDIFDE